MFKLDTHVHTSQTSPCGRISADEVVRLYKEKGYDGIIVTDHYSQAIFDSWGDMPWDETVEKFLSGYRLAKQTGDKIGIKVYLGIELRFKENSNDYLVFGITEELLKSHPEIVHMTPEEFRIFADENSLAFFQAHPFRPGIVLKYNTVHGCEVYNGHYNQKNQNHVAYEYAEQNQLLKSSGSDCHQYNDVGNGGIILKTEPTQENLGKIFLSGDYELIRTKHKDTAWYNNPLCDYMKNSGEDY